MPVKRTTLAEQIVEFVRDKISQILEGANTLKEASERIAAQDDAERLLADPPSGAVGELLRNKG